jgi:hypothetical protein
MLDPEDLQGVGHRPGSGTGIKGKRRGTVRADKLGDDQKITEMAMLKKSVTSKKRRQTIAVPRPKKQEAHETPRMQFDE